jgi:hypothetical protein
MPYNRFRSNLIIGKSFTANYVEIAGAASGSAVSVSAKGASDSNVDLNIVPKGTGVIAMTGTGALKVGTGLHNYLSLSGNTTGNAPTIGALGGDTNIPLGLTGAGTGGIILDSARTDNVIVHGLAGGPCSIGINGSGTNIGLGVSGKGTGGLLLDNALAQYLTVKGHATGPVAIGVAGTGVANVAATIDAKGTGTITLAGTSTGAVNVGSKLTIGSGGTGFAGPFIFSYGGNPQTCIPSGTSVRIMDFPTGTSHKLIGITLSYLTAASGGCVLTVEKTGTGVAPGSGTPLATYDVNQAGPVNTPTAVTITGSSAECTFAATDSLSLKTGAATTGLTGCVLTFLFVAV